MYYYTDELTSFNSYSKLLTKLQVSSRTPINNLNTEIIMITVRRVYKLQLVLFVQYEINSNYSATDKSTSLCTDSYYNLNSKIYYYIVRVYNTLLFIQYEIN